jgi:hypothetical protein
MGWAARNKGTYDQRKTKAIQKRKDKQVKDKAKERDRIASMSPEEKDLMERVQRKIMLHSLFRGR